MEGSKFRGGILSEGIDQGQGIRGPGLLCHTLGFLD